MTSHTPDGASPASKQSGIGDAPASGPTESVSAARPVDRRSLVDAILDDPVSTGEAQLPSLAGNLAGRSVREALKQWIGPLDGLSSNDIGRRLNRLVALIDKLLNEQLNAILHHPKFQRLEAAWRNLRRLVERVDEERASDEEPDRGIKVKLLSVSWNELKRDFDRAIDFDQSQLFQKVYEREFGTPGGQPFGVLLGDYEISASQGDVAVLQSISGVAAAAFCPFIASPSPAMFGLDDFSGLETSPNLARVFQQKDYIKWRALRDTDDSRFVGLVLPRVLARLPYRNTVSRVDRFSFSEDVSGPDASKYLWGNAAFAFGEVIVRAFARSGWLAGIRGVERDVDGGGRVTGLPVHCFATESQGFAPKCSTDVLVTDTQERELSDLGFMPLCQCHDTNHSAFYGNESVQKPKKYSTPEATRNARISSMLQYTLCVSRFAHYLKALARDKIGGFTEADECERILHDWIVQYVTPDSEASRSIKAKRPLREARVQVRPHPAKPGEYQCVFHLWPHFELDDLVAAVRLDTELGPELRA